MLPKEGKTKFTIKLAGYLLSVCCFQDRTKFYCKDFLAEGTPDFEIELTEADLRKENESAKDGHLYVDEEITALYRKIADCLIEKDIIVFHSSAFMIDGKAYLVSARSGTGKSTHAKYLQEYLGERFRYINDDKPLLERKGDEFIIHSSPWNGKERRGENISAPLKGILFLTRGEEPSCEPIPADDSLYFRLLSQIYLPYDKKGKEIALGIADSLRKEIPFYEIKATLSRESAVKTYERIHNDEA